MTYDPSPHRMRVYGIPQGYPLRSNLCTPVGDGSCTVPSVIARKTNGRMPPPLQKIDGVACPPLPVGRGQGEGRKAQGIVESSHVK
ncbi:MAG: hypothetical protein ACKO37_09190 [Vampirovibrionales bacterium]